MAGVSFAPNDDEILVDGIAAPPALYVSDGEGLVNVTVTNNLGHGMEFDSGDALLSVYSIEPEQCHQVTESVHFAQLASDERAVAASIIEFGALIMCAIRRSLGLGDCGVARVVACRVAVRVCGDLTDRLIQGSVYEQGPGQSPLPAPLN